MLYRVEIVGHESSIIYFEKFIDDDSDNVSFCEKLVAFCEDFHNRVKEEDEFCEFSVTRFKEVGSSEDC